MYSGSHLTGSPAGEATPTVLPTPMHFLTPGTNYHEVWELAYDPRNVRLAEAPYPNELDLERDHPLWGLYDHGVYIETDSEGNEQALPLLSGRYNAWNPETQSFEVEDRLFVLKGLVNIAKQPGFKSVAPHGSVRRSGDFMVAATIGIYIRPRMVEGNVLPGEIQLRQRPTLMRATPLAADCFDRTELGNQLPFIANSGAWLLDRSLARPSRQQ